VYEEFSMLRSLVCGFVCLVLAAGFAAAEEKKAKARKVGGAFASFKDGTLTIKVKGKKGEEPKSQDFKVAEDVKVTTFAGEEKKEGTAKDSFTAVKEGTPVTLTVDETGKVTAIQVGAPPKKKKENK
jgi:hypothetical protein